MADQSVYTNGFRLAQGEVFEECPYNRSHRVTNQKFLTHLDKCRQTYKKGMAAKGLPVDIKACRFNWIHHFPVIEIESHERRCQDQFNVIPTIAFQNHLLEQAANAPPIEPENIPKMKRKKSKKSKQAPPSPNPIDEEEDWDNGEADYKPGCDPKLKLESNCYLYVPRGLKKSERKQFRKENRLRYAKDSLNEEYVKRTSGIPGLNYVEEVNIKSEKGIQKL